MFKNCSAYFVPDPPRAPRPPYVPPPMTVRRRLRLMRRRTARVIRNPIGIALIRLGEWIVD